MFGGQDNNAAMPQTGGGSAPDETLKGIDDLAASLNTTHSPATPAPENPEPPAAAPAAEPAASPASSFMPTPSEPAQSSVPAADEEAEDVVARATSASTTADADDLLDLKQQALQQLTPIVGHLSQTAEEKFRTTMMLIQASDNQALLKDAYEAAQAIPDEKVKAQALLDVINEINYFTQNNNAKG